MRRALRTWVTIFLLVFPHLAWSRPTATILNPQRGGWTEELGTSLAMEGDWLIAGAPGTEPLGLAEVRSRNSETGEWEWVCDLQPDEGSNTAGFGVSADMSGDTIVVGACDIYSNQNASREVHVYVRNGESAWTHQAILTPSDSMTATFYGFAVAISGDTLAVGGPADEADRGRVYVYERNGSGNWSETAILEGLAQSETFGRALALEGDIFVVGDPESPAGDTGNAGMALVYERDGLGTWTGPTTLTAPTAVVNGRFGNSLDVSGNTVIVGALRRNPQEEPYRLETAGYVFVRQDTGIWQQQASLEPPTLGPTTTWDTIDRTAASVAICSDTAVVLAALSDSGDSSTASLCFYERNGEATWNESSQWPYNSGATGAPYPPNALVLSIDTVACAWSLAYASNPPLLLERNGVATWEEKQLQETGQRAYRNYFGQALAATRNTLFVGAPNGETGTSVTGAVFAYDMSNPAATPVPLALSPPEPDSTGSWGQFLAVSSNTLAIPSTIGGPGILIYNGDGAGAWTFRQRLEWPQVDPTGALGEAVAMDGNVLAATSREDADTSVTYVIVYRRDGTGTWSHEDTISEPDTTSDSAFGYALAITGDVLFVGAPWDDTLRRGGGAVHVYRHDGNHTWNHESTLTPDTSYVPPAPTPLPGLRIPGPASFMYFGMNLAADSNTLLVAQPFADNNGEDAGLVDVFAPSTTGTWTYRQTISPSNPITESTFGGGLALSGSSAIVVAPFGSWTSVDHGASIMGYLFSYDTNDGWQEEASFHIPDGAYEYRLDRQPTTQINAVFLDSRRVVIAGEADDTQAESAGAVYLYDIFSLSETILEDTQTVQITSDGRFYAFAHDFGSGDMGNQLDGETVGNLNYDLEDGHWIGLYLYDYTSGQWSEAMYILRNTLE